MKLLYLAIIVCITLLAGCSRPHLDIFPPLSNEVLKTQKIAPQKLKEDIDSFYRGVVERHPDLASYADLNELEKQVELAKQSITEPMTRNEFYKVVGRLSHYFNDGHSFLLWPYQELAYLRDLGQSMFPFAVEINPDGLYIKHAYSMNEKQIAAGTQILSINGVNAAEIIRKTQQYTGGETRALREQFVASRFSYTIWSVYGFIDQYELVLQNGESIQQQTVGGEQSWLMESTDKSSEADFYYKELQPSVGYLYVGHFDVDVDWFEDFIDEIFASIKQQGVSSLIIDIRDNTGGNTDTVTYLSRHVATKPFLMVSAVKEKLNQDNRGLFGYKGNVGEMLYEKWDDWQAPVDDDVRFDGDTYLLISQVSYSSAIVFATTLKDNEFATLIGQTTGGFANQTAQGNLFNLPNSELRAYVPTRLLLRSSGDSTVQGVVPHYETRHDKASVQSGVDTEVLKALALIAQKSNAQGQ